MKLEATGGGIPYKVYVEANLQITDIKSFNENVLMLATEDSSCAQRVPTQLGMLHIDRALELVNKDELHKLRASWQRSHLATLMTAKLLRAETGNGAV